MRAPRFVLALVTAAPLGLSGVTGVPEDLLALTNGYRAQAGCPAVALDDRLTAAAQGHSADMAERDYLASVSPEGRGPVDRIRAAGYRPRTWGENLAAGYLDTREVFQAWVGVPANRAIITDCAFRDLGVGFAEREGSTYTTYWTQTFGAR